MDFIGKDFNNGRNILNNKPLHNPKINNGFFDKNEIR